MRRSCGPLLLAALILSAPAAAAAPQGPAAPAPPPATAPAQPPAAQPPPWLPPSAHPPSASPPAASPGHPPEDPPYNPWEHDGLSYGAWLRATRGTGRRSPGMMITGLSLVGLAATLMATGTGVFFAGSSCKGTMTPSGIFDGGGIGARLPCGPDTSHPTGLAILASGVITLGVGIPLSILGAGEVPRAEAARLAPPLTASRPAPLRSGATRPTAPPFVSLGLGLGGGQVTLHF